jgi:hypothetical protein
MAKKTKKNAGDELSSYIDKIAEEMVHEQEPKPWTWRGVMLPNDKQVIEKIVENDHEAARIFVTGEVTEDYIGDAATQLLVNVNDVYYKNHAGVEPLFINTRTSTVRMARFDPAFVWRCFHPDILVGLIQEEAARLGVDMDPWNMEYFDFYQNMVAAMKATYGEDIILIKARSDTEDYYHGVYLACLILFGKPGYMDVLVAEHFAQPEAADFLRGAIFLQLNEAERHALEGLRKDYSAIQALTNPEMHFVVDLYERYEKVEKQK